MWMKYRHKWSSGTDREWTWIDIWNNTSKDMLEDILHELSEKYDYSEHYRGIDYELAEYPPVQVIEREIQNLKEQIKSYESRIDHLKNMIAPASVFEVQKS